MTETIAPATSDVHATDSQHRFSKLRQLTDWIVMATAVTVGLGSIVLFAAADLMPAVRLKVPTAHPLWWDAGLSVFFFAQHSGMVRRGFQSRFSAILPTRYHGAAYSIASGVALTLVVVLWQRMQPPLLVLTGVALWSTRLLAITAAVLFVWTVASSSHDMFGVQPIRRFLRGRPEQPPRFFASGAYALVRHPFYACVIALLWCAPVITPDRLLLNVLWTTWIIAASFLEERDLVTDFGDVYRDYRRRVPMLVPWRGRAQMEPR